MRATTFVALSALMLVGGAAADAFGGLRGAGILAAVWLLMPWRTSCSVCARERVRGETK
jgi:hypothetical protein